MAEKKFKYDVFISYSHKDEEWVVNTLLPALENAGLKVCIDFRDFKPGKPSRHNMRDACKESAYTVLVMTPAWMASEWTEFEGLLTFLHDPSGKRQRTVPILLEKCDIPEDIQIFTYVDFTRKDREAIAWKQLFIALGKPDAPIPASRTPTPTTGSRDTWYLAHPYPMPPNFTGRVDEQTMLDDWLADDKNRLFILRALGGFGKSALVWQWINTHVNPAEWTKLVWWSFYEGDASFEHFIEETLKYLKLDVPQGQRPQVDELLKAMQSQKILLIMDGFERALRAYSSMNAAYQGDEEPKLEDNQLDCVNINAEIFLKSACSLPNIKSKVLMTTRHAPRAIKPRGEFMLGCREEELTAMKKADAVEFFHKQKIKGTHAEIEAACAPYGYHPLSLRLLAGRILKDFDNPADIIVAQKLKIDGDVIQQKHHVLEVSYDSPPKHEQKLLGTISCFRSPVDISAIEAIANNKKTLEKSLHDLLERGLVSFNEKNRKFEIHPIVRRFAYEYLTKQERSKIHTRLCNYFSSVETPSQVESLENLAPAIEHYYHTLKADRYELAYFLFSSKLSDLLFFHLGAYQLMVELLKVFFTEGEKKPPKISFKRAQSWLANELANAYGKIGLPTNAVQLFVVASDIDRSVKDKKNLATDIANMGVQQLNIGAVRSASSNLKKGMSYFQEVNDITFEAFSRLELGRLLILCGQWEEAEKELKIAKSVFDKMGVRKTNWVSVNRAYFALRCILMIRSGMKPVNKIKKAAIRFALIALELANERARLKYPHPQDFVNAYWLLGVAYFSNGQVTLAEQNLIDAMNECRKINNIETEASILLDLARLRYDQKNYEEAKSLAEEALSITERCGYVLQGADVNLFLAQYALEQEKDKVKAKEYAESALKLATCDGPPYYYKVAYEEAERMLEKLSNEK